MPQTKLHFARFEFKYLLSAPLRAELERELRFFVEFDPFVIHQENHQYFVRSLYFDDPAYTCFQDKVDGLHTRGKFRLRTYSAEPSSTIPCFLEIKGRYNNLVLKHRTPIRHETRFDNCSEARLIDNIIQGAEKTPVREQFEFELYRKRLRPITLVDYVRRPYFSRFDPDFRLTFDSNLSTMRTRLLFPSSHEPKHRLLPGYTVMEVKFRRTIPAWFHHLIQSYQLQRTSISKICKAMENLGLAEDM